MSANDPKQTFASPLRQQRERSAGSLANAWNYLFSRLLALLVDFAGPWEPTFVLLLPASTAARRVSALSVRVPSRALCAALRWLARRFISFALCAPRIGSCIALAGESTFSPLTSVVVL